MSTSRSIDETPHRITKTTKGKIQTVCFINGSKWHLKKEINIQ